LGRSRSGRIVMSKQLRKEFSCFSNGRWLEIFVEIALNISHA
jgi:hypothetical protein